MKRPWIVYSFSVSEFLYFRTFKRTLQTYVQRCNHFIIENNKHLHSQEELEQEQKGGEEEEERKESSIYDGITQSSF